MKKFRPLNDQIISKPIEENMSRKGNIIVPDSSEESPVFAKVVEVSEGIYNYHTDNTIPHKVKKDDVILLPKMGVYKIQLEGEDYFICQASQLLAIIEDEA